MPNLPELGQADLLEDLYTLLQELPWADKVGSIQQIKLGFVQGDVRVPTIEVIYLLECVEVRMWYQVPDVQTLTLSDAFISIKHGSLLSYKRVDDQWQRDVPRQ